MVIWIKSTHSHPFLVHWFLRSRCLVLPSPAWQCKFTLIHRPNLPGPYALLFFTASDFTFTSRPIHNWAPLLLLPSHFILSQAISNWPLLFSSSISDTSNLKDMIVYSFLLLLGFVCLFVCLPFHIVHGVLQAGILESVTICFSSGPRFIRTLHYYPSIMGGPTQRGS